MNSDTFRANQLNQELDCVLGGGGIKGFCHIGFLRATQENGINFANIYGTSIGALVGTLYTNGFAPEQILEIMLDELGRFGKSSFSDGFKRPLAALRQGGLVTVEPMFASMVARYNLTPQPNLKIVAAQFSGFGFRPYLFQGLDYDLVSALVASCAMPPFISSTSVANGAGGKPIRLMDGGLFHATPYQLCTRTAIISRPGIAEKLPAKPLQMNAFDLTVHLSEMLCSPVKNYLNRISDPRHLVIETGDPTVATFAFGLSDEACHEMVDFGYKATSTSLNQLASQKGFQASTSSNHPNS